MMLTSCNSIITTPTAQISTEQTAPNQIIQTPTEQASPEPSPMSTVEYIIIKGEQYSIELTSLQITQNNLQNEDIIPLVYMTNLSELELWDNQISDLTPISGLTNLKQLRLSNNQISDLAPLSNLTKLTVLHMKRIGCLLPCQILVIPHVNKVAAQITPP